MNRNISFALFMVIIFCSCHNSNGFDKQKETQAITAILQHERKAHFDRNADLFISTFADSMLSVNRGKVSMTTPEENKERFGKYFGSVKFIKWDDVAAPIIRFSDDGSLAYAIIQKQVILSTTDSGGKPVTDTTDYAWASVYRKKEGKWEGECNISTNK
ncbi:MAG: hypothetical protein ABI675_28960 [Chitinophagaceae bacterium]